MHVSRLIIGLALVTGFLGCRGVPPARKVLVIGIDGIRDVILRHTWNPPWTAARMTDAGRQVFGLDD